MSHDPHAPSRVMVGAGPGGIFHEPDPDAGPGQGLWLSEDGALSFVSVAGLPGGLHISDIAFDPIVADRVIVATNVGLFVSVDGGVTWDAVLSVARSARVVWHANYRGAVFASVEESVWVSLDAGADWEDLGLHDPHGSPPPDSGGSSVSGLSISSDGQTLYVGAGMGGGRRANLTWSETHPAD